MNFTSSDFQCPVTGIPVILVWNEDTYVVTAKICSFIWETWKENNPQNSDKEVEKVCLQNGYKSLPRRPENCA